MSNKVFNTLAPDLQKIILATDEFCMGRGARPILRRNQRLVYKARRAIGCKGRF